jgi:16S rRNA processing protein RimM
MAVEWIELGRVGAPFGIKGWVRIASHTDPPEGLLGYREWVLRLANGERLVRRVIEGRQQAAGLVAHLEGVEDRGGAAALTGAAIEIDRAALPSLPEREYYRADLLGLRVRNLEGAELGTVSHFVDAPAGAVMVARGAEGLEHWVLARPPHLRSVDLAAGEVLVDWPAELE